MPMRRSARGRNRRRPPIGQTGPPVDPHFRRDREGSGEESESDDELHREQLEGLQVEDMELISKMRL